MSDTGNDELIQSMSPSVRFALDDVIDDLGDVPDHFGENLVCRKVDTDHSGQFQRRLRATGLENLDPGLGADRLVFDHLGDLGSDRETCRVRIGIETHEVVGLSHPRETRPVGNLDGLTPEFLQDTKFESVQDVRRQRLFPLDLVVDFPLEGRFEEVCHEVMIIRP
jgi:hypothetical protein